MLRWKNTIIKGLCRKCYDFVQTELINEHAIGRLHNDEFFSCRMESTRLRILTAQNAEPCSLCVKKILQDPVKINRTVKHIRAF